MNFGKLLAKLNNDVRSQLRQLEKLKKSSITVRWSKISMKYATRRNIIHYIHNIFNSTRVKRKFSK